MSVRIGIILFLFCLNKALSQNTYFEGSFSFSTSTKFDVEEPYYIDPLESRTSNSLLVGFESKIFLNFLYYNAGVGIQQNRFKQLFETEGYTFGFYNFSTFELKIQLGLGFEKKIKKTNTSVFFECGFTPDFLMKKLYQIENTEELLIPQEYDVLYSNDIRIKNSKNLMSVLSPYFSIGANIIISERFSLRTYCQVVFRDDYIITSSFSLHPTSPNGNEIIRNPLNSTLVKFSRLNMGFRLIYSL